ncbi:hypothetical protein ACLKA6_012144 [Drosophila palustris]
MSRCLSGCIGALDGSLDHWCHKTLLAFHNLRAAVSLLLLAVNSLELARSLLPQRHVEQLNQLFESSPMELNVMIVIGSGAVWNALAAILLTIMLMCYHRLLERKKVTGFLYGSITVEMLVFLLRIDELAEVFYYEDFLELETSLVSITVLSLLTLAIFDGYTIYKEKKSKTAPSLWYCYIKNSWRMFALGGILKLAGDLFALIGPLAIQQIVQYIEELYAAALEQPQMGGDGNPNAATDVADDVVYYADDDVDNDDVFSMGIGIGDVRIYYARWLDLLTNGWSIAWLVLLAALAQAALSQASTHVLNMTGIRIKTSLQGLIYRKSLLLNASSGCGNNAAQNDDVDDDADGDGGNPATVNPPTATDVQQNGDIKLTPNDKPAEVDATQQTERSGAILTHISTVLITLVTLAVYVYLPQDSRLNFNASHLFSALALFQQLTVPLLIFPITVPIIIAARVSTRRLERFLHAPEIQKQFEGIRNMARILSKSDASLDMYETQEKSNLILRTAQAENRLKEQRLALRLRIPDSQPPSPPSPAPLAQSEPITPLLQANAEQTDDKSAPSFTHELGHTKLVQQRRELLRNTPYVAIRPPKLFGGTVEKPLEFSALRARNTDSWRRDSLLLKMPDDIAVSINDGLFTWQPQSQMPLVQLHVQEMAIPKGKLTIIVGKNGSGKTSLLSALLMEMPLLAGNMFWHKSISEESSAAAALLPTTVEQSSVPSLPAVDISNPQQDTTTTTTTATTEANSDCETKMHKDATHATPVAPVKHVKIDFKALPTNERNNNNNNNNDDNDDDVSDVTSLSQPEKQRQEQEQQNEQERERKKESYDGAVKHSGVVASTMATPTPTLTATATATDVERKYGQISHHIYLLYMRASGLPIIIAFFITALIWQCLRVYTDVWLQHWSDHVPLNVAQQQQQWQSQNQSPNMDNDEVTYYFRMYATISCVCIIMAMISTPAGQWAGCNARRNLHDKLLQTILHKTLHFFQVTPLGRIVNRFSNDMAIIDKKIAATSQRLLQFSLLCLFAILINVSITPWFLALTLPICGAYYAIQKFYRCSARELQRIENSTNSPVISHLSETIQGVTTIRAYNQQARFTEILFKRLEANTIAFTILNTSNRWLGISLDYLGGCIVFVAIVTALATASVSCSSYAKDAMMSSSSSSSPAGTYVINKNGSSKELTPTPSLVGLAINYTLLVPIYLNWVVKLLADMEMYAGSVERIAHYAQADEEEEEEEEVGGSETESEVQQKQDVEEISNEVDRSRNPCAVDKVYPGATSAAVDVDGDTAAAAAAAVEAAEDAADKLNAGNGNVSYNHLNFRPASVVDKLQQATTRRMIKDKRMTTLDDKVALSNEPARRIKICEY